MDPALRNVGVNVDALNETVCQYVGTEIKKAELVGKNDYCKTVDVSLQDGSEVIVRILSQSLPSYVMESDAATINYIATRTSIPVPRVLQLNLDTSHPLGVHMLLQKVHGMKLATVFSELKPHVQDNIVSQIARWTIELFQHRFNAIGSLHMSSMNEVNVGPIVRPPFYVHGRAKLPLDRGPFTTSRAYFVACAQRELDCSRTQFSQDTSQNYQKNLEDARFTVERSMALLLDIIRACKGLDDDDPVLGQFSLDFTRLDLSKIYVSADDPSRIVSLPDWHSVSTGPLWHCARLPSWLTTTLSEDKSVNKTRLEGVFRKVIAGIEGRKSLFLCSIDLEDTRRAIDDVCEYDAFTDGFLLLPTLESIIATLPGSEDMDGLKALLDPSTLEGRAARIALLTRGSGPLSLATQGDIPITPTERASSDRSARDLSASMIR